MSLLTVDQAIAWVPQLNGSTELATDAIEMAEALADEYCGRDLESAARTETYDIGERQGSVQLRHYPVDTTKTFTVVECAQDSSPTTVDADNYFTDAAAGILYRAAGGYCLAGDQELRVTYTAGYTTATLPAGLRRALLQLVAWVLESRGNVGTKTESVDGASVAYEEMDGVVPASIGRMLQPWKAVRIG